MSMTLQSDPPTDGIAVIGMACRLPGAHNVEEFWRNLRAGVESVSFFDNEARDRNKQIQANDNRLKPAGIIEDADLFDAKFFGYTRREAEIMDPQHRLFLECAWEAMEHAGYDAHACRGLVGVFAGSGFCTYLLNNLLPNLKDFDEINETQIAAGNERDALASTVSYNLNLTGPSLVVQSFCSTSLVAIHLACQSLLNSECDMALAGAVEVSFPQEKGYHHQIDGVVCRNGQTRTFDADAQGCVKGNGLGIVVLKRVQDAISDGDCIYAVIKGSAVNNDGFGKVSYLAPSFDGQTAVIVEALANAGVSAETISYVETHGSATLLGDSIEIAAATKAFRASTDKTGFCAIGSCKTNIGNLERAAGIAGFIKTVLALFHRELPPTLHFERPNPEIDFANSPFYVQTKLGPWNSNDFPRRAGISSFGMGGTNAHVVLEEAPPTKSSGVSRPYQVLLLSAQTPSALETAVRNLLQYFRDFPQTNIADVAFTMQVGRSAFNHRCMVSCDGLESAQMALQRLTSEDVSTYARKTTTHPAIFLFPGLGEHYPNMASGLYLHEPFFRDLVDRCAESLQPYLHVDFRKAIFSNDVDATVPQSSSSALAELALFAIEYALAQQLIHWGIRPAALLGFSLGEYVAAVVAGVLSLEDALLVVARRAALLKQLPIGAMLEVSLSAAQVEKRLGDETWIAAVNSPQVCVVAGGGDAISELEAKLEAEGVVTRRLQTHRPFHTPLAEQVAEEIRQLLRTIWLRPPQTPFLSNLTGEWIKEDQATDVEYWVRQMCSPVQFRAGVRSMLDQWPNAVLVEVGPGQRLTSFVRQEEAESEHPDHSDRIISVSTVRLEHSKTPDEQVLGEAVGKLWLAGVPVEGDKYYEAQERRRVGLPTYPFERERFWIDGKTRSEG